MKKKILAVFAALILPVMALAWTVSELTTEFSTRESINRNYAALIPEAYYYFTGKADAYSDAHYLAAQNPSMATLHVNMQSGQATAAAQMAGSGGVTNFYNYAHGRYDAYTEAVGLTNP